MKPQLLRIAMLPLLAGLAHGGDFIRQIQTISGQTVIYDIPVATSSGQVTSQPLTSDAAVFQLYATDAGPNNTEVLKKLDEKTVGTFLPAVIVEALSEDPFSPPRTRADKPFGMRVKISGLRNASPDAPSSTRTITVYRSYKLYDPATFTATDATGTGTYAETFSFEGNGTFTASGIIQQLPSERPTKAMGEESFTAMVQTEPGAAFSELGKATIQIWPVADAQILDIEEGEVYQALPSTAAVAVRDLYPQSNTYVQVYKGPYVEGTTGTPLPLAAVSYQPPCHLPQNANLALTDLPEMLDEDGEYTLEVLTITPFNGGAPEHLAKVSFHIKRGLTINGMITTME